MTVPLSRRGTQEPPPSPESTQPPPQAPFTVVWVVLLTSSRRLLAVGDGSKNDELNRKETMLDDALIMFNTQFQTIYRNVYHFLDNYTNNIKQSTVLSGSIGTSIT